MRWAFIRPVPAATIYLALGCVWIGEEDLHTMALMSGPCPSGGLQLVPAQKAAGGLPHDLDEAMANAREVRKPVMIDFTGWACVNCGRWRNTYGRRRKCVISSRRIMCWSRFTWTINAKLPKETTAHLHHLYGKAEADPYLGNKWSTVQLETFVISSQPYYALLSPDGRLLTDPWAILPTCPSMRPSLSAACKACAFWTSRPAGR
jgi:thiol:disulfide interchange protein DsbD